MLLPDDVVVVKTGDGSDGTSLVVLLELTATSVFFKAPLNCKTV